MLNWLPLFALCGPFFGASIVLFIHKRVTFSLTASIVVFCLTFSLVATVISWYYVVSIVGIVFVDFGEIFGHYWLVSNWGQISFNFIFDELCLCMFLLVVIVSLCVHLYSLEYMCQDPNRNLFLGYLSLFTFFMLLLVSSGNFVQFFMGWEGIGMCSYLLINFWYMRVEANKAAIKAVVVNKIGDCAFVIGSGLVYCHFKTLNLVTVFNLLSAYVSLNFSFISLPYLSYWDMDSWTILTLFFLIAVMSKSAQLGFHTWLPDAMEGPTPVSALIHAATMVTAGIFFIIRAREIFELSPVVLELMVIIGVLTAFFGASVASVQNDIKKIIAYSTCSQLGYMLTACGLSKYGIAFFHLVSHGFFKALLFLGAGAILHGLHDNQDLRRMGYSELQTRFLGGIMFIGTSALTGFPCYSGFYSKDLITYTTVFDVRHIFGEFFFVLLILAMFLTIYYSGRLYNLAFAQSSNTTVVEFHSSGFFINIALVILAIGSLGVGFFFEEYFMDLANRLDANNSYTDDLAPLSDNVKDVLVTFFLYGLLQPFISNEYLSRGDVVRWFTNKRKLVYFFAKQWYFDKLVNFFIASWVFKWAYKCFYLLDVYLFELFGPRGLTHLLTRVARAITFLQSGSLFMYLVVVIVFILVLFFV